MGRYKRLTFRDRQRIEKMCRDGAKPKEIAEIIGIHVATVYREIDRGTEGGEREYSAEIAQRAIGLGI